MQSRMQQSQNQIKEKENHACTHHDSVTALWRSTNVLLLLLLLLTVDLSVKAYFDCGRALRCVTSNSNATQRAAVMEISL